MKVCFGLLIVACAITDSSSQYRFNFNTRGRQSGSGLGGSLFDLFNPSGFFSSHLQQAQKYLASASGNRKQYRYPGRDTSGSVSKKPVVDKGPEHSHKEKEKHGHGKPHVPLPVHETAHVETDPECVEACLIAEEAKVAPEKCHCAAHICDHVTCSAGSSCRLVTVGGITEGSCLPVDSSGQVLGQTIGAHDISGCGLPLNQGSPCQSPAESTRFYFDIERQACFSFQYTGCAGNKNNYNSLFQCEGFCTNQHIAPGIIDHHNTPGLIPGGHHNEPAGHHNEPGGHHNEPLGHHNEPLGHHNEPAGHHNEPGVILGGHHHEPAGHHNEPLGHHNEPAGHHHEHAGHHNEPGAIDHHGVIPDGFPSGIDPRVQFHGVNIGGHGLRLGGHGLHLGGHGLHLGGNGLHLGGPSSYIGGPGLHFGGHGLHLGGRRPNTGGPSPYIGGLGSYIGGPSPFIGGGHGTLGNGTRPNIGDHGTHMDGIRPNTGGFVLRDGLRPNIGGHRRHFGGHGLNINGLGRHINGHRPSIGGLVQHDGHRPNIAGLSRNVNGPRPNIFGFDRHVDGHGSHFDGHGSTADVHGEHGVDHGVPPRTSILNTPPATTASPLTEHECITSCEQNIAPEECHCAAHLCDTITCPVDTACRLVTTGGLVEGSCLPRDSTTGEAPGSKTHGISGCGLPLNEGSICARAPSTRYYFNVMTQECSTFAFSGCGGNINNFHGAHECQDVCMNQHITAGIIDHHNTPGGGGGSNLIPIEPPGHQHGPAQPIESGSDQECLVGCEHNVAPERCHCSAHLCDIDKRVCAPGTVCLLVTQGGLVEGTCLPKDSPEGQTPEEFMHMHRISGCGLSLNRGSTCALPSSTRFYFDRNRQSCFSFQFNGCGGNDNSFKTASTCEEVCMKQHISTGIIDHHNAPGAAHGGSPLDHIEPLGGHGPHDVHSPHGQGPHVDAHGPTIGGLLAPHVDTHGPNIGGHDPHVDAHGGSPLGGHEPHAVAEPHVDAHGTSTGGHSPHVDAHGPNIGGLLSQHVDAHVPSIGGHGPHVDAHEKHTAVEAHEAVCGLARERGTQCTSNGGRRVRMYYFDNARKRCRRFGYTGCGGNANRFPTREACFKKCQNPRVATASRLSDPRLPPVLRLFGGGGGRLVSQSTNLFRNSRPDQRSRVPNRSIFGLPMNNVMSQLFSRGSTGSPFSFGLTSLNGNRPRYAGYRPRALAGGKATKKVAPPADKY